MTQTTIIRSTLALLAACGLDASAQSTFFPAPTPRSPAGQGALSVLYGNDASALIATLNDALPATGYGGWLLPAAGPPTRLTPAGQPVFISDIRRASSLLLGTRDNGLTSSILSYSSLAPSPGAVLASPPGVASGEAFVDAFFGPGGVGVTLLATEGPVGGEFQRLYATEYDGMAVPIAVSPVGTDVSQVAARIGSPELVFVSGNAALESTLYRAGRFGGTVPIEVPKPPGTDVSFPSFNQSPACASCVALVRTNSTQTAGDVIVTDLSNGREMVVFSGGASTIPSALTWSPDGRLLAFVAGHSITGGPRLIVVRPPIPVPPPPTVPPQAFVLSNPAAFLAVTGPAWSPDSARLAFLAQTPTPGDTARVYEVQVCYANCDGSSTIPVLNALDFSCFLNRYTSGNAGANCDGSTTIPVLNALDFSCFLRAFQAGCP